MGATSDNIRFTVYCDGAKGSHADRRWTFTPFVRPMIAGVTFPWSEQFADGEARSTAIVTDDNRYVDSTVLLEMNAKIEKDRSGANVHIRRRFKFKCKVCGLPLECRYDQLEPILDTLRTRDKNEISLADLAAILRLRSSG